MNNEKLKKEEILKKEKELQQEAEKEAIPFCLEGTE